MRSSCIPDATGWSSRARELLFAALVALTAVTLSASGSVARAAEGGLGKEDLACLKCHDKESQPKTLPNGDVLTLHVSTEDYLESMHKETSCEDCHADIDGKTHGKVKSNLQSRRELSLSMRDSCKTCHKKKFAEYEDSVHAALIKEGSTKAPLCSDCHRPHTLLSVKLPAPIAAVPCAKCHEDIFKAYSKDVHGLERAAKGKVAPLCYDCHQAHAVKAASLGEGVKDACLACHKDAIALHKDWLPNSGRHLEAISCPACHSPDAQRRVNLRLYDGGGKHQVSEKIGVPKFARLVETADSKGLGLDERALWSLLKEFNTEGAGSTTTLRGRLEVRTGVEAHQIAPKEKAIRTCNFCHQADSAPFQSVTLTIAGPDGRPLRHGVQKDVLNSLTSLESVRGFYAIGATRIKLLDVLLVLVLLGAISVPLIHMTIKWMFRNVRARLEAERAAARAPAPSGAGPAPRDDAST